MKTRIFLYALIIVSLRQVRADADEPWLSEPWGSASNLTALDSDFQTDLSGAIWNPVTRTLWVCRNKGPSKIWSLVEDGSGGFEIYSQGSDTGKWDNGGTGFGDAEGITQADYSESNTVYIVVEEGEIREYDLSSYTTNVLTNTWNISAYIPAYFGGLGPEGIAFVPDASLQASGFVDTNSVAYTSTNGMGGLMFVAHQRGGRIYVFDLNRTNATLGFVGAYKTGFEESSGLEFDRSNDVLYVSHGIENGNNTNKLQALSLGSYEDAYEERVFTNLTVYEMPGATNLNLEGLAVTPRDPPVSEHWIFLTQDDGGSDSLMWFREYTNVIEFTLAGSSGPETNDTASIEITLSGAYGYDATVDYSVTGGTASNGVDYTLTDGTATITAGNTSTNITITDITDSWTTPEFPETIIVTLSNPGKAVLGTTNTHTYTINDYPRLCFQTPSMIDRFTIAVDTQWNSTIECSGWCLGPATNEMLVLEGDWPIRVHNLAGGEYTNVVRTITMSNVGTTEDVEGICQVDPQNNLYAIGSERPGEITLAVITTNTTALDGNILPTYAVTPGVVNDEIEGVAYDPLNACFYAVKEKNPMAVYKVSGVPGSESVIELFDISKIDGDVTDLSDMFYDPYSGHLFLLSHKSLKILECDLSGNIIADMPLSGITQPEALTFSANLTNMYVGSETEVYPTESDYRRYVLSAPTTNCEENSTLELPVVLSWGWPDPVTVNYTLTGTGANPATPGTDVTPASGTLTFPADDTAETITLTIPFDAEIENDETFEVRLSSPTNCSLIRDVVYSCTISSTAHTFVVESVYGNANPPSGTNVYEKGTNVTCTITNTVVLEDTQSWMMMVCTGWTGSGSVPVSGATTNTGSFSLTENSAITWHWTIKDLILSNQTVTVTTNAQARDSVIARDGYSVEGPGNVTFRAGEVIKLQPGFIARTGSVFRATIDP